MDGSTLLSLEAEVDLVNIWIRDQYKCCGQVNTHKGWSGKILLYSSPMRHCWIHVGSRNWAQPKGNFPLWRWLYTQYWFWVSAVLILHPSYIWVNYCSFALGLLDINFESVIDSFIYWNLLYKSISKNWFAGIIQQRPNPNILIECFLPSVIKKLVSNPWVFSNFTYFSWPWTKRFMSCSEWIRNHIFSLTCFQRSAHQDCKKVKCRQCTFSKFPAMEYTKEINYSWEQE